MLELLNVGVIECSSCRMFELLNIHFQVMGFIWKYWWSLRGIRKIFELLIVNSISDWYFHFKKWLKIVNWIILHNFTYFAVIKHQNNQKNMALKLQSDIEDLNMMIELTTKKFVAETKVSQNFFFMERSSS